MRTNIMAVAILLLAMAVPTRIVVATQGNEANPIAVAKAQMQAGDFARAAEALQGLLSRETKPDPEAFMLLAACLHNLKADQKAIEVFDQGLDLYPRSPDMQDFYVALLRSTSSLEAVKAGLTRRYERDPDSLILLRALIYIHLQLEYATPKTEELVSRFVKLAPGDPNSHFLRGEWARLNKRDEEAVDAWEKCLTSASPDETMQLRVQTMIALAQARLGHFPEAKAAFDKAHETNKRSAVHDPDAAQFYLEYLQEQGEAKETLRIADQILAWDPSFGPARLERASLISKAGQHEESYREAHLVLDDQRLGPDRLRAARILLIRLCSILKLEAEAKEHESWIKSH